MITSTTQRFWRLIIAIVTVLWRFAGKKWVALPLSILLLGYLCPQPMIIPVEGATTADWNKNSFWAYPWGSSITHKGIDVFASNGTNVLSSTHGLVVYTSEGGKGGKAVMILGPKWRFHYYAHLESFQTTTFTPVKPGSVIGTVGTSGNAAGKAPHLHYAITTPVPYVHLYDSEAVQGWKKMFYLKPDTWIRPK